MAVTRHAPAATEGAGGPDDDALPAAEDEPAAGDPAPPAGPERPRRGRRPWTRVAAVAAALVVAAVAAVVLHRPAPRPGGLVILYGDSLATEASGDFVNELRRTTDAEVVTRVVPGEAPCDALDDMQADLDRRPTVVVISYAGNNGSACTRGPAGEELTGDALTARYDADVRRATELFATAGTRVVLVGGPDAPGLPGGASAAIADDYHRIVNEWAGRDLGRVRYADAGAVVSAPDGAFAEQLPCRSDEGAAQGCAGGEVAVRNPDGIHFCPGDYQGLTCDVASPGARRFGDEMARVTRIALDPDY
jgi:hypothetical protein